MTIEIRTRVAFAFMIALVVGSSILAYALSRRDEKLQAEVAAKHEAIERAEAALAEADFCRKALLQSNTAVARMNRHGIIDHWSKGAEEVFGWTKSEAVGGGPFFLIPSEMREQHSQAFNAAIEKNHVGFIQQIKCVAKTKDGGDVPVYIKVTIYKENDGELYVLATINRQEDVKTVSVR